MDDKKPNRAVLKMLDILANHRGLEIVGRAGGMARYVGPSRHKLGRRAGASRETVLAAERMGLVACVKSEGHFLCREYHYRITRKGRKIVSLTR